MFKGIVDVGAALEFTGGFHFAQYIRPSVAATAFRWQDFSLGAGIPRYNAYVGSPLVFTQFTGSGNNGIYHGEDTVDGEMKRLYQIRMANLSGSNPSSYILCDYLGFYPLIDYSDSGLQEMDNALTLSRYADGEGVMMMLVNAVPTTINASVTVNFINSENNARSVTFNTVTATLGQLQNNQNSVGADGITPWIQLGSGCKGVKSITSVQSNGLGDGFGHIVLVKPLAIVVCYEQNTPNEVSFVNDKMTLPKIENGAFLNFIGIQTTTATQTIRGELTFLRLPDPLGSSAPGAAPAFSFTPDELTGLELWLKADAGLTESGGNVTAWLDQSGNSRNPTVQGTPAYTASGLNGKPIVQFDGTSDWLQMGTGLTLALAGKSACEMIMVLRRDNSGRLDPLIDLSINGSASLIYHDIPLNDLLRVGGRSDLIDTFFEEAAASSFVEDSFEMVSMIVNIGADRLKYYLNNTQSFSVTKAFNSTTFATSTGTQNALLAYFDGTAKAAVTVAEIIIYSQDLSDADKDKVAWYLNDKYNIGASYIIGDPSL